eukprot:TRINITY_DN42755_c0_g1_i1.p1 TRINITY_DN42755_c0_g1~~TRINITY_DN42755_c0_g1_i1.p1  ORF type:complete len:265 (+),score=49.60 TRINITY_DN42755_c0_g1_i1:1-795(+)
MRVSIVGIAGEELLHLELEPGTRVQELQERISAATGAPPRSQRLIAPGALLLPAEATLAETGSSECAELSLVLTFEVVDYRVMQGCIFKKPGQDPTGTRVLKLTRDVGMKIATTGRTWMGPAGGTWVECDPASRKPGWMLVDGYCCGMLGPLLERVDPDEEEPLVLKVRNPRNESEFLDVCLKPTQLVLHARHWISWRFPGMKPDKIVIVRERWNDPGKPFKPADSPSTSDLRDDVRIAEACDGNGTELKYIYMGDIVEDLTTE